MTFSAFVTREVDATVKEKVIGWKVMKKLSISSSTKLADDTVAILNPLDKLVTAGFLRLLTVIIKV